MGGTRRGVRAGIVVTALVAVLVTVLAGCGPGHPVPTPRGAPGTSTPSSASSPAATGAPVTGATPGADGVGDALFPHLGNGGYEVEHYALDLRYATAAPTQRLDGTVTVDAVATQALSRFDLDFAGDGVGTVAVDGVPARFTRSGQELVITPAAPIARSAAFTVTVGHVTATPVLPDPKGGTAAFTRTVDGTVWTGQPAGMHRIFPCNDHPGDKASFSFTIDVPAGTTAVANGDLVGRTTSAGRTVWRYEERAPMATELVQVAVGRFTVIARGTTDGVTVRDVVPTRLVASLGPRLAAVTSQLRWMEARVGPFPFTSYGSLDVDTDLGFALETQTLSVFDRGSLSLRGGAWQAVMVHELAHQWFGDSVSPTAWRDVWQNEGHATYYEFAYAAEKGVLAADAGDGDLTHLMRTVYRLGDQWRGRFGPPGAPRSSTLLGLFNPDVYYGGALVLYALHQRIGAAAFDRLERGWVGTYRGRSASTADFIALATRIGGPAVGPFLRSWLYDARTPAMPGHPDWTTGP